MISSYFKMARRSLMANKSTTLINILGLVLGVASALVISSVIRFEQSFDSFHSKKDDIYRVVRVTGQTDLQYRSGIIYPLHYAMKDDIPGIEVVALDYFGGAIVDVMSSDGRIEKKFVEKEGLVCIEPEFFKMFDFNVGSNIDALLKDPGSVVLTKSQAKKYFGNEDPVGQTLKLMKTFDVKVTGVVDDFPSNTDFPFTMILSYSTMPQIFGDRLTKEWVSVNDSHAVFVYAPNKSKAEIEAHLDRIHAAHVGKDISESRHYRLQEFKELHYDPRFGNFSGRTITHETIMALAIVVLFLLLAGCINYINLSTAQSTLRSKEIGLRKVLGSQHSHLIIQFLTETFVVVGIASFVAVGLVVALMPSIKNLLDLQITYDLADPMILISLAVVVIVVTLCSGLYPAYAISKFNPIATLRAKFNNDKVGGINLRKVLVVAQFTITQILAVGTFIVISQMNFFQNVDMGFNRKAVVVTIPIQTAKDPQSRRAAAAELKSLPFVSGVAMSFTLPSGRDRNRSSRNIGLPDAANANDFESYEHFSIDESFLDLYQVKLLAGRNLKESDTTIANILVNATLSKNLGFDTPEKAIGAEVKFGSGERATIAGVVGDFYSNSLKENVDNTVMVYKPVDYRWFSIRLDLNGNESMAGAISDIEKIWNVNFPEHVFQYQFLDENIKAFYKQEFKYSKLFQVFSIIFIGIGCLGLYGLITFIANKKGKEIAVRKTLGATISNIIVMFSKEYVTLIGISFMIAVPVVWYGVNEWLSGFSNHIDLQWWMFVAPGAMVLTIALLVVGSKSYSAARANPVEKLKCE